MSSCIGPITFILQRLALHDSGVQFRQRSSMVISEPVYLPDQSGPVGRRLPCMEVIYVTSKYVQYEFVFPLQKTLSVYAQFILASNIQRDMERGN